MSHEIGRNAIDNTRLVNSAQPLDVWFHLSDQSSAHLIYKNTEKINMKDLSRQGIILRCALRLKVASRIKTSTKITYCYVKDLKTSDVPGLVYIIGKCYHIYA
jgi:predicted ribosome quality control (RQC) complex YloA/Tae2 family protein